MSRAGLFRSALAGALLLFGSAQAMADTRDDILTVYRGFAEAQNARDLDRIGAFFVVGPDFLWVSDGQSVWGRPDVLKRMSGFQKAEVWHVVPDLDHARVVELDPDVAMLHMPLVLELGAAAAPDKLRFLVSILFRHHPDGWKIASLLTTTQKPVAP